MDKKEYERFAWVRSWTIGRLTITVSWGRKGYRKPRYKMANAEPVEIIHNDLYPTQRDPIKRPERMDYSDGIPTMSAESEE